MVVVLSHGDLGKARVHRGDSDIVSLGVVAIMGDDKLRILLVDFKALRFGCGDNPILRCTCNGVAEQSVRAREFGRLRY